jgi:hypothetical protein
VGVEGCGKKASYVHLKGYGNEAVWGVEQSAKLTAPRAMMGS